MQLLPLTDAQLNVWFHQQLDRKAVGYNTGQSIRFKGPLDLGRLAFAQQAVLERFDNLRCRFVVVNSEPFQYIEQPDQACSKSWDARAEHDPEAFAQSLIAEELSRYFDLEKDQLCRFGLIQLADEEWEWFWVTHHLINDGWGWQVGMQYMAEVYLNPEVATQTNIVTWATLVNDSQAYRTSAAYDKDRSYWATSLEGFDSVCSLSNYPVQVRAPTVPNFYSVHVTRIEYDALVALGKSLGTSVFSVLVALYAIYLARMTGKLEICLATPSLGRDKQARQAGGMMTNPVVLRISIMPGDSLADIIRQISLLMRGVLRHSRYPAHSINQNQRANKSVDVLGLNINLQSFDLKLDYGSVAAQITSLRSGPVGDSSVQIFDYQDAGPVEVRFEYESEYFQRAGVVQHVDRLTHLIKNPPQADVSVAKLKILRAAEENVLFETSRGHVSLAAQHDLILPEIFERQVARTPEATALVCGAEQLSYAELDERANQLARHLIAQGVGPEQVVAILLDRSTEMVVSLLAVLKAGAAYLPMDPSYPIARLGFMLADSCASVVISTSSLLDETDILNEVDVQRQKFLPINKATVGEALGASPLLGHAALKTVKLDDYLLEVMLEQYPSHSVTQAERRSCLTEQNLAYLIYTSGSSGTPKGAGNTHTGGANLVAEFIHKLELKVGTRALQFKSFAFDASFLEMLPSLCSGATLYLIEDASTRNDPVALGSFIERHQIVHADIPPVMLAEIPLASLVSLQTLIVGGEASSVTLVKRHAAHCQMFNCYGPTESAVCVTAAGPLNVAMSSTEIVPIGRPIQNTQIYILDAALNPLPLGVAGELYIAGMCLARGYLGRTGLTSERFIANPFESGARMYRSGDLARWTGDGVLEYLGRADAQVKIRGFRIELGEIEAALLTLPSIAQCTVQARGEDSAKQLVAYVVATEGHTIAESAELKDILGSTLPDYMVPAAFVVLDTLPLTPNGKLDARALPAPEFTGQADHRAPVTEYEQLIASLYAELTGAVGIGLDDSFFALGGHSLLAMRLIAQIRAHLGFEIALRTLFEQPTVAGLAQALELAASLNKSDLGQVVRPPILPGQGLLDQTLTDQITLALDAVSSPNSDQSTTNFETAGHFCVLSYGQIRLWTLAQIEGATGTYNMPTALTISGDLHVAALELALRDVIDRHEPLRTVVLSVEGEARGYVRKLSAQTALMALDDLSAIDESARALALKHVIEGHSTLPFDLTRDLMVRARLIKVEAQEHVLALVIHHIAGDGVSMSVFCRELTQAYLARTQNHAPDWKPLSVSYADHAAWQRAWLESSGELTLQSESWQAQLAGIPELLTLPTDYPRDANRTRLAGYLPFEISIQTTERLQSLANQHQTTLFTVLIAFYGALLGQIANQSDVVIGAPIAGRTTAEVEGHVGFFVNTLALRVDSTDHPDLHTLIERVKNSVNHAIAHQDLPFERLVEDLGVTRSLAHAPVFQAMLGWQTQDTIELFLDDLRVEASPIMLDQTKFDVTLSIAPSPDGAIRGILDYDTSLFSETRAAQWLAWLSRALDQVHTLQLTQQPIDMLALTDQTEQDQVLERSAGLTVTQSWACDTVTSLIEAQALLTPATVALSFANQTLTYQQLNARANKLARYLISQGVGPDQIVAILLERSVDMIVSVLAVLKAGAAYLPLDRDYPSSRLEFMVSDSQAKILITTRSAYKESFASTSFNMIDLEDLELTEALVQQSPAPIADAERSAILVPDHLAYLIYTSGSTGRPKGVSFTHAALVNLIKWQQHDIKDEAQRVLQYSPISFDASAQEIIYAFTKGHTLILVKDEVRRDGSALIQYIAEQAIDQLYTPFVVLNSLADAYDSVSAQKWPKEIFTAGEQLQITPSIRKTYLNNPTARLHNYYGPTESHVVSTYSLPVDVDSWDYLPPIGQPIWNTQLYVLNEFLNLLPDGVTGELYIAGINLARGYFNRPTLTAERFIACPFGQPGARMYRTGDLAYRREDGEIVYLGRADQQVKIRGFRIELGEIEAVLLSIQGVRQCAVQPKNFGVHQDDKRLVAYLVPETVDGGADTAFNLQSLQDTLAQALPDYMIPGAFVVLDALPLTPNGKLDTRALPMPEVVGESNYRAPVSKHEQLVAKLYTDLTGAARVGLDDSFFALGGHSLLAMRLVFQIRTHTGFDVALRTLFELPTVMGLARALDAAQARGMAGDIQANRPPIVPGQGAIDLNASELNPTRLSALQRIASSANTPGHFCVLSYGQIRLWTLAQIEASTGSYNMPEALTLSGELQIEALELALLDVIDRHEPLRTIILNIDGEPVGFVQALDSTTQLLQVDDFSALEPFARTQALDHLIRSDSIAPFDLSKGLMIRARIVKLKPQEYVLTVVMHHIAGDGVSMGIFCQELTQAYRARLGHVAPDFAPMSVSYADHAAWQRTWLEDSDELNTQRQSWQRQLSGIPELLSLPTDYPRDARRSRTVGYRKLEMTAQVVTALQQLANQHQTTLFTVIVTLYGLLLGRLANQTDVVIGSPVAGRTTPESDELMGFFINTLALRVDSTGHPDLNTLIDRVKNTVTHALAHQELPFERLVEDLEVTRSLSHTPVFQAMLAWQNQEIASMALDGLSLAPLTLELDHTKFDLTLSLGPMPDGSVKGMVEYDASLFSESRVEQWMTWFLRILEQAPALSATDTPADALSLLDDAERQRVLTLFNQNETPETFALPPITSSADTSTAIGSSLTATTLPELFERQVVSTPEAIALVVGDQQLTYVELERRANQLARHLTALGIGPEQVVALALPRSVEMVVSLLAVLKCGAAYLPLDPDYPSARLSFMLEDSHASLLITHGSRMAAVLQIEQSSISTTVVLDLDESQLRATLSQTPDTALKQTERLTPLNAQHLAYVIYTSGSTGTPKGACNTHNSACNLVHALTAKRYLNTSSKALQFKSFAFDASFAEIMPVLCAGGALVLLVDASVRSDPNALGRFIAQQQITHADIPPVLLAEIDPHDLAALETLIVGGEASSATLVKRYASLCNMFNEYGPTEACVCSAIAGPLDATIGVTELVPIGHPLQNAQIYILDAALNPLPSGMTGELYIAGKGLARGYLGKAGLTSERFIANPFDSGSRMYRSGDLARWTQDGVLEYLGRADAQVKIRGFRIELGEIEAALLSIPGIAQCTVQARGEDSAKQLVAYLVSGADETLPEISALRETLADTLPDYMVPAAFVSLESLPLTPNGKIDSRALPTPEIIGQSEYRAPVTVHEQLVATLVAELTGATRVGLDDSFFALGGHSLLAMRLLSQIRLRTELVVTLRTLFEQPTVLGLAHALDDAQVLANSDAKRVSRPAIEPGQGTLDQRDIAQYLPALENLGLNIADLTQSGRLCALSYGQVRLWTLTQIEGGTAVYNMPAALTFSGALQAQALELALLDVINRHEPLRTVVLNVEGVPLGYVKNIDSLTKLLAFEDLSQLEETARALALEQLIKNDSTVPFELSRDLMVRARLIKLEAQEHVLSLAMHHIASDGVSMGIFCRELTEAYQARIRHSAPVWAPLPISYSDHAAWQRAWLEDSGELVAQSQSWQSQLAGIPELLSLPTDYPRDANRSRASGYLPIELKAQTVANLQSLANQHQTTLFTVLVALYGSLLGRIANQSEVVIGSPVAGRTTPEVDDLVGVFINTLALRIDSSGHPDLNTLIQRTKKTVNHALAHQELPFERLVEDLEITRSLSHTPVFQAMLAWHTQEDPELSLENLAIGLLPGELEQTKFDLTLSIAPAADGAIRGILEYDASLFDASKIAQWLVWFVRMLERVQPLALTHTPVGTLSLLDERERNQLLTLFNQTAAETESLSTETLLLPQLFEQQVQQTPKARALTFGEAHLTYEELDQQSNQLARHLIKLGIGPEKVVALALPRSLEMVVSLLAVLKSGAAYLPLDPYFPSARLAVMLTDSRASLLITQAGVITQVVQTLQATHAMIPVLDLSDQVVQTTLSQCAKETVTQTERLHRLTSSHLAYILYTSGSTGKPKGVQITHLALLNFLLGMQQQPGFAQNEVLLAVTTISFDIAGLELYLPLICGGSVVLASRRAAMGGFELSRMIQQHQVDVMQATPATWRMLMQTGNKLSQLKRILCGGEALDHELASQLTRTGAEIWNLYGPTETTIWSTSHVLRLDQESNPFLKKAHSPIGRPIRNTQVYILDAGLNPVPIGIPGELYIAGTGLARGYRGGAGLTAERFVANPFDPAARMYRTGDLALWTEQGELEYLGRIDAQVKIRGFRIELGEIEAALVAIPGVAHCTVQARGEGSAKQLVAYLIAQADQQIPETASLRSALGSTLPGYMVPSAYVVLESFPLTPNGKLDARALPAPENSGDSEYRAPLSEHEQLVANLYAELTGATRVGLDDSFFALGGHSLLAMRLISQLRTRTGLELALRILFEHPTVAGLAQTLDQLSTERQALAANGAVPVSRTPMVLGQGIVNPEADGTQRVLSYGQIRLWTIEQIQGSSGSYNMPMALRLTGPLRVQAFELALIDVITRHEPLRTTIVNKDGQPLGYVREIETHTQILEYEDLHTHKDLTTEASRHTALEQIIARDSTKPFNLSRDLMVRARLIKLSDSEHMLTLVVHHIAGDGVSMGVLCQELNQAYQARSKGHAPAWAPLTVSYADHAAWQRAWLEDSGELERQSLSWQVQLAGFPERLTLPTDYPRDANRSRAASYLPIEISAQTTSHLQSLANRHQTTLFTVLIALYGTLLGRLANQSEVVIGSPVAGRTTPEVDGLIGIFINTLALRVDTSGHPDLNTLIGRVKSHVNHALTHQELPFERLVEDLGVTRSLSHTPVFQAMLAWQTQQDTALSFEHLTVETMPVALAQTKFDLALSITPEADGAIRGVIEYDASLFTERRVAQWATWFVRTLDQAHALIATTTPVDTLSLLDDTERNQVVALFNQTDVTSERLTREARSSQSPIQSPSSNLPELFEQQVARTPGATALVFGEQTLTYAELDARANQLARHLIGLGIGPERIVALALPRSIEMVVALLAVSKSGAAYLPLDPDYPAARLAFMLTDSRASLLITLGDRIGGVIQALQQDEIELPLLDLHHAQVQVELAQIDHSPISSVERIETLTPQSLAYLIYTSGSTGTPKGVGVSGMAQAQMLLEHVRKLDIRPADRCLQLASMAFDVASAEIGMALVAGAALVILEDNDRVFGETLAKACEQYRITHFMCVPNALETCPIDALFSTVRCIVVGGTSCPPALVKRFGKTRMFKNAYGPTETTVFASISDALIPNEEDTHLSGLVSIGRPIQNTQIYILDASLNPLPVGVAGELYISGAGLARGYLGRSGLTAERFVANPFAQPGTIGARMYRSGDLARWTEDGVLEYLDRADGQVKIRGFRIELGEIEAALNSMPGIAQCTVQAIGKDDAKQLVAYLVAAASTDVDAEASIPKPSTLRAMLSNTLPDYMVPAAFVVLEALPLTPNGKLDARALPAPEIAGEGDYRPPVTEHEQLIAALFAELTGATRVGLDDSFFALGGHSLLAMRLTARVNQACGAELSLRAIFESPTPESLALHLGSQRVERTYRPLLTLNKTGRMPRLFCLPPAGGIATVYKNLSLALGSDHPVEGLQARGVDDDEDQFDSTMAQATQSYVDAITELQPSGPYYLLGMSLGGTIAQEVAVQLEAKGETVAAVFLIDTMTQYELPDNQSKTENEQLSELLAGLVQKDPTTDQALTPNTDELLTIFQKEWEDYGMVPVGTPRAYFLKTLKNSLMSSSLIKNHAARQCQSPIVFFKGTLDGERNTESFDWQPYTAQPIIHHKVASKHAEMLWQPASYQLIARVVQDVMANDVKSSKT